MNVSSIGLTNVAPTTGTPAQRPDDAEPAAKARTEEPQTPARNPIPATELRSASDLTAAPARGPGAVVDKRV